MKIDLKERTFKFSINILDMIELFPRKTASNVVSYQLAKSATSVGVNYRASRRARSDKELLNEANELTAIFVVMLKNVKKRVNNK